MRLARGLQYMAGWGMGLSKWRSRACQHARPPFSLIGNLVDLSRSRLPGGISLRRLRLDDRTALAGTSRYGPAGRSYWYGDFAADRTTNA